MRLYQIHLCAGCGGDGFELRGYQVFSRTNKEELWVKNDFSFLK